jgi:NADH:ubiquinone oxidoreductase subunit K
MSQFGVGLTSYLLVAAILFSLGLYGVFAKKNIIAVLMSIELMLNAVNLNFVAFNRFIWNKPYGLSGIQYDLTGHIAALFAIVVAAAEIAVGLALVITIYRTRQTTDVNDYNWLKW